MKKLVLVVAILVPFAGTAKVGSINQNGNYWHSSMSESEKVMYVWGFRDGYEHGYFNGRGDVFLKEGAERLPRPMTSREIFDARHPSASLSNGDIIKQVDRFYGDYRNIPVCIDDAVIEAIESLKGHPWTDGELAIYRRPERCSVN